MRRSDSRGKSVAGCAVICCRQALVVMGGTVPLELAAFGAAKLGLVDELETCLSQGAPVNATDAEGEIAFQPKQPFREADRRLTVLADVST